MLVLGLRWRGRGFTSDLSEAAAAEPDLLTTVEADGVGESGLLFSSPELLPVEPELTPLELFRTRPLLEPPGTAGMIEVLEVRQRLNTWAQPLKIPHLLVRRPRPLARAEIPRLAMRG